MLTAHRAAEFLHQSADFARDVAQTPHIDRLRQIEHRADMQTADRCMAVKRSVSAVAGQDGAKPFDKARQAQRVDRRIFDEGYRLAHPGHALQQRQRRLTTGPHMAIHVRGQGFEHMGQAGLAAQARRPIGSLAGGLARHRRR